MPQRCRVGVRGRQRLDTATACQENGFGFLPFIVEARGGGLGPVARRVVSLMAKTAAA